MPQRTLKEFADAYKVFTSTMTKEEFINAFKEVVAVILAMKKRNEEEMRQMEAMHEEMMRKLEGGNSEMIESAMEEIKKEMHGMIDKMMAEHERGMEKMYAEHEEMTKEQHEGMKFIYDKVRTMKSGKDGENADEEKIVEEVIKKLPKKDFDFESLKTEIKDTLKSEVENIRKVLQNIPRGKGMGRAKVPII